MPITGVCSSAVEGSSTGWGRDETRGHELSIRKPLAVGAALAAVPALAFASPASAAGEGSNTKQATFETHWDGKDISCTVEAHIESQYNAEHDQTNILAYNVLYTGDPECDTTIFRTSIVVTWRRDEESPPERSWTFADRHDTHTNISVNGRLTSVDGHHGWAYGCETSPDDECDVNLSTSPK
jgi:hypothetical protein